MLEGDTPRLLPLPCYVENSVSYSSTLQKSLKCRKFLTHPLSLYSTLLVSHFRGIPVDNAEKGISLQDFTLHSVGKGARV
jgi:hypothetical protein